MEHEEARSSGHIARRLGCLGVLSMLIAAPAAAQDQPDFSGRWVLVAAARAGPDVAQSLTVRQPVVRANAFGGAIPPQFTALTVERQLPGRLRTDTYPIGAAGGIAGAVGGAGINLNANPSESRFAVRWENNRLVIEVENYSGLTRQSGPFTEHSEIWQLDDAGMLVLSIADRGSDTATTANTLIYRRN